MVADPPHRLGEAAVAHVSADTPDRARDVAGEADPLYPCASPVRRDDAAAAVAGLVPRLGRQPQPRLGPAAK